MDLPPEKEYLVLRALDGNDPSELNWIQLLMEPHAHLLEAAWLSVWIVTACVVLFMLAREYRRQRRSQR